MDKSKKIDFKKIEAKWQKVWEKSDLYRAIDGDGKRKKKYVLVEFPYPSGFGLHIGHAFTMTGADVYARKKRMDGFNVLFPMGWDAFGLPTENHAIKEGIHPRIVTKNNTDTFKKQMKRMAFSFDWEREINTTDPDYYRWTQWIFIKLFERGLAYKEEKPINWCPDCKIGLANEEVVDCRCERCGAKVSKKNLSQWTVKITDYADRLVEGLKKTAFVEKVKAAQINWIGRSEGVEAVFKIKSGGLKKSKQLKVFTTRPDTLWGVTFMVVAPEHELVREIVDLNLGKPGKIREIKEYVGEAKGKSELERAELQKDKTGVFTGLYAVNPVNNKRIPIYVSDFVLSSYGTGAIMAVPAHDERDWQFAKKYRLPIIPVIQPEGDWDFGKAAYLDVEKGKMINSGFINGLKPNEAITKVTKFLQEKKIGKKSVSYHLRDWIFSRQHYWGEPIPMVYCRQCGWQPVAEKDLPVTLPEVEKYEPTDTGESPLANIPDWVETTCPKCGGKAKRETDTMPNWAGSDWYFLRYTDPKNKKELASKEKMAYWMPVDVYVGGDEHNTLHLLYSRFIYQFLHDIDAVPKEIPEPYYWRLSHGVILGSDNQRMSKSKGNDIAPDQVIEAYGVDALRTYMMFMGPFGATMAWNDSALKGVSRFLDRFCRYLNTSVGRKSDRETKLAVNKLVKKVSEGLDKYRFNTSIALAMETLNFLERNGKKVTKKEAKTLIQVMAPFAPYLTEELWSRLGEKKSVHGSFWPKPDSQYLIEDKVKLVVQINGRVRATIEMEVDEAKDQKQVEVEAKKEPNTAKRLKDKEIIKTIFVPGRLINFVVK